MAEKPISLGQYRAKRELEPLLGQLDASSLADLLNAAFECWVIDLNLDDLPEDIRRTTIAGLRAAFRQGVGKMAYVAVPAR